VWTSPHPRVPAMPIVCAAVVGRQVRDGEEKASTLRRAPMHGRTSGARFRCAPRPHAPLSPVHEATRARQPPRCDEEGWGGKDASEKRNDTSTFRFLSQKKTQTKNNPLFLETYGPAAADAGASTSGGEDALRFHYAVHCALDAVEERRAF
jgi:hypothetical protein